MPVGSAGGDGRSRPVSSRDEFQQKGQQQMVAFVVELGDFEDRAKFYAYHGFEASNDAEAIDKACRWAQSQTGIGRKVLLTIIERNRGRNVFSEVISLPSSSAT